MSNLDWEHAREYLYEMKKAYEEIGMVGSFVLVLTISPLIVRFEAGERTQELYDTIMGIE